MMLSDLISVILALLLFSTAVGMYASLLNKCPSEILEGFLFKYVGTIDQYHEL